MSKQSITILGATGSIGCRALDVIARHRDRYRVFALTAKSNIQYLVQQCREFAPRYAVLSKSHDVKDFKRALGGSDTQVLVGQDALIEVASHAQCDTVLAGIVGTAGLLPTLAAAEAGKRILLANKEVLVSAGAIFMHAVAQNNALLLPIDSEHNGLFQCLNSRWTEKLNLENVKKFILTASGGPCLQTPLADLPYVTPEQACAHPNWEMGAKISVDSATMMNKGLEVIEACRLFHLTAKQIEIVIHPQSLVHAMVCMKDGSVLAQMSRPDMRVPIAHALAWPQRIESGVTPLDLTQCQNLTFQAVDFNRFPCLCLAYQALKEGEVALIALNAANEIAVSEFLAGKISFDMIDHVIRETLQCVMTQAVEHAEAATVDIRVVLDIDRLAREQAHSVLSNVSKSDIM